MNLFSRYTAHRAGIILTGEITMDRLYNSYSAFCRLKGQTPEPYEAVEVLLANDIYSIKLWWGAIVPHMGQSVLGRYISEDLDRACQ